MLSLEERKRYLALFDKYQNFLSKQQKLIMTLYLEEDNTYEEIASHLKITKSAVASAFKKGIQKLENVKELLKDEE